MSELTAIDRFWRGVARYVDKPILRHVASQRVLRALFEVSAATGSVLPRGATVIRDRSGGLTIRPQGVARDAPAIFYIHGGGFTIGSPRTHAALAGRIAAGLGARAYLPRYGLAPEQPYPAAPNGVFAAYRDFLSKNGPPLAIAGDSAGGCLALLLAQAIRDEGLPAPHALALIAPIADLARDLERAFDEAEDEILIPSAWAKRIDQAYLAGADPTDPKISPIKGDLSGLPPAILHVGGEEALRHDAEALAEAMHTATVKVWPGLPHVFHLHAGRAPAANQALDEIADFLKGHAS